MLPEIVTRIRVDTSGLTTGLNETKRKLGEATNALTSFRGVLATAAGSTLVLFARNALNAAGSLGEMSQRIGVNVESLQQLQHAARQSDVSVGELETGLRMLNRSLGEAAVGSVEQVRLFKQIGVSVTDSTGRLRDASNVLDEVADVIAKTESPAKRTQIAMEAFGRSGTQLLPMLQGGSAGLAKFREEAERLGLVLDERLVNAADAASDTLDKAVKVIGTNLTRAIITVAPHIESLSQVVAELAANWGSFVNRFMPDSLAPTDELANRVADQREFLRRLQREQTAYGRQGGLLSAGTAEQARRAMTPRIEEAQKRLSELELRLRTTLREETKPFQPKPPEAPASFVLDVETAKAIQASHVAAAEAAIEEYEKELAVLAELADAERKALDLAQQQIRDGYVATAQAEIDEYEQELKLLERLYDEQQKQLDLAKQQIREGYVAAAEAEIDAYEAELKVIERLHDEQEKRDKLIKKETRELEALTDWTGQRTKALELERAAADLFGRSLDELGDKERAQVQHLSDIRSKTSEIAALRGVFEDVFSSVGSAIEKMATGVIQGTLKMRDAFRNLAQSIVVEFAQKVIRQALNPLIEAMAKAAAAWFGGGAAGGTANGGTSSGGVSSYATNLAGSVLTSAGGSWLQNALGYAPMTAGASSLYTGVMNVPANWATGGIQGVMVGTGTPTAAAAYNSAIAAGLPADAAFEAAAAAPYMSGTQGLAGTGGQMSGALGYAGGLANVGFGIHSAITAQDNFGKAMGATQAAAGVATVAMMMIPGLQAFAWIPALIGGLAGGAGGIFGSKPYRQRVEIPQVEKIAKEVDSRLAAIMGIKTPGELMGALGSDMSLGKWGNLRMQFGGQDVTAVDWDALRQFAANPSAISASLRVGTSGFPKGRAAIQAQATEVLQGSLVERIKQLDELNSQINVALADMLKAVAIPPKVSTSAEALKRQTENFRAILGTITGAADAEIARQRTILLGLTDPEQVLQQTQTIRSLLEERYNSEIQLVQQFVASVEQAESAWRGMREAIEEQIVALRLSGYGPTNPSEAVALTRGRFDEALAAFRSGPSAEGAQRVSTLAEPFLEAASRQFSRPSEAFRSIFDQVTAGLNEIAGYARSREEELQRAIVDALGVNASSITGAINTASLIDQLQVTKTEELNAAIDKLRVDTATVFNAMGFQITGGLELSAAKLAEIKSAQDAVAAAIANSPATTNSLLGQIAAYSATIAANTARGPVAYILPPGTPGARTTTDALAAAAEWKVYGDLGGAYASGLEYVPYDEFPARLHRGEAVLTAQEAEEWRRGESDLPGVVVTFAPGSIVVQGGSDPEAVARAVAREIKREIEESLAIGPAGMAVADRASRWRR